MMYTIEVMAHIELCISRVDAVTRAVEEACPLYVTDRDGELERLLSLVSVLREETNRLKAYVDSLDVM